MPFHDRRCWAVVVERRTFSIYWKERCPSTSRTPCNTSFVRPRWSSSSRFCRSAIPWPVRLVTWEGNISLLFSMSDGDGLGASGFSSSLIFPSWSLIISARLPRFETVWAPRYLSTVLWNSRIRPARHCHFRPRSSFWSDVGFLPSRCTNWRISTLLRQLIAINFVKSGQQINATLTDCPVCGVLKLAKMFLHHCQRLKVHPQWNLL